MSEEIADLFVTLRANTNGFTSAMTGAVGSAEEADGAMASMAGTLATLGAAFAVAGGAWSVFSVKAAGDFQSAMVKVQALAGASAEEIAGLHDQVLTLSSQVGESPKALADALYFIESAGHHGADALDILRLSGQDAASGLGDLSIVSRMIVSSMNAYSQSGLDAKTASDELVKAVALGVVPSEDLATSLGRVMATSAALGVSLPEVTANIATMTRAGMSSDQAATALQSVEIAITKLSDPSKKTQSALDGLGLSGQQLADDLKNKGLAATLGEIVTATDGNESSLVKLFPNVRALKDVLATAATQGDVYAETLQGILGATDGAGATAIAFGLTQETVNFQISQAVSWVQALAVRFGEWLIPKLQAVVQWGQSVNDWLQEHQQVMKELATGALVVLTASFAALGAAVFAATWEFVAVGTALFAIGAGAMWAYDHVQWFHDAVDAVSSFIQAEWPKVQATAMRVFGWLQVNVPKAWDAVYTATFKAVDWLRANVPPAWEKVRSAAEAAVGWIKDTAVPWLTNAYDIVKGKLGELADYFSTRWNDIKDAVQNTMTVVVAVVVAGVQPIIFIWDHAHGFLMDTVTAAWKFIRDTVKAALETLSGVFDIALGLLSLNWARVWEGLHEVVGGALGMAAAALGLAMNIIGNVLSGALDRLKGIWSAAWSGLGTILQAIYDNTLGPIIDAIRTAIDAITSAVGALTGKDLKGSVAPGLTLDTPGTDGGESGKPHNIGGFLQPGENLIHQDEIVDRDTGRVTPVGQARKRQGGDGVTQHNTFHVYAAPQPLVTAKRVAQAIAAR